MTDIDVEVTNKLKVYLSSIKQINHLQKCIEIYINEKDPGTICRFVAEVRLLTCTVPNIRNCTYWGRLILPELHRLAEDAKCDMDYSVSTGSPIAITMTFVGRQQTTDEKIQRRFK